MANERSLMKSTAALAISASSGKIKMLPELSSPVKNLHLPTCMTLVENSLWPLASVNMLYGMTYSDNNDELARMMLEVRTF